MLLQLMLTSAGSAQKAQPHAATPVDPFAAVVDAFRTHDVVTLTDPHGNVQIQSFLLSLVRDRRFPDVANDIVIETASARYQDVIDRFVRGDDVDPGILRKAWEDHTVANSLGVQAEEFIRAVRAVNASLTEPKRLRVVAGDPPIDWADVCFEPGPRAVDRTSRQLSRRSHSPAGSGSRSTCPCRVRTGSSAASADRYKL